MALLIPGIFSLLPSPSLVQAASEVRIDLLEGNADLEISLESAPRTVRLATPAIREDAKRTSFSISLPAGFAGVADEESPVYQLLIHNKGKSEAVVSAERQSSEGQTGTAGKEKAREAAVQLMGPASNPTPLTPGVTTSDSVLQGQWQYYTVTVQLPFDNLDITVIPTFGEWGGGGC